ncbi:MAG: dihydropteroate synthase [Rickettsiaceae bacterium H1]|nr:dihydropteroate synthase [Rickettsiaceae bacterium H1]
MVKIVGILNVTPDSFSDGGKHNKPESAINHVEQMIKYGADIIDIGSESTRPGATPIDETTELVRIKPILQEVISLCHDKKVKISIDTYKSKIAEFALSLGVDFINDVTGFINIDMIKLAVDSNKKIIIVHNLWKLIDNHWVLTSPPESKKTKYIDEIVNWGKSTITRLKKNGIKQKNIIIDPGIGFGKTNEQSWNIINNIEKLHELEREIYVGHSKKRCTNLDEIDKTSQNENDSRSAYTLAISTMLALKKVNYIRVHDVWPHKALFKKIL